MLRTTLRHPADLEGFAGYFLVDITDPNPNNTADTPTKFKTENRYNGLSPSGFGIGNSYDPSGSYAEATPGNVGDGYTKFAAGYMRNSMKNGQFLAPTGRHADGSNFLMADDHAKYFRSTAVSAGGSAHDQNAADFAITGDASCGPLGSTRCAAGTGYSAVGVAATFSYQ